MLCKETVEALAGALIGSSSITNLSLEYCDRVIQRYAEPCFQRVVRLNFSLRRIHAHVAASWGSVAWLSTAMAARYRDPRVRLIIRTRALVLSGRASVPARSPFGWLCCAAPLWVVVAVVGLVWDGGLPLPWCDGPNGKSLCTLRG